MLLYAKRQQTKGYCFGKDTVWQTEFEDMFPFDETKDQLDAIDATKKDMESNKVMDRLICGDVGYGKTEIAIRAAFKAANDGKQVAFLVPTTILAQQHYNTFKERLGDYPVRVEMLSRFRTPAQQKKALEHINSECRRLERLSGKMMTLIGLYDEDRIHKEPYPVEKLIQEVADLERYHMQDSGMELQIYSESWEYCMDVDLMESLLVNLLDNAIKASEKGSVIELHGEKGCIWVRDHGKGIPKEEIPKITEAFYMVDKSRSRKAGGIGMGLALCQKIAEIHGARLLIESTVGVGTRICVIFQEEN